jgi:hypothetical protein
MKFFEICFMKHSDGEETSLIFNQKNVFFTTKQSFET